MTAHPAVDRFISAIPTFTREQWPGVAAAYAADAARSADPSNSENPKAQEWTHPPVPSVGDYVRLTFRNGSTADGEVKSVPFFREGTWDEWCVRLDGGKGGYIFSTKHRTDTCILGDSTIVGVEHIEPPRELLWPKGTVVENNHTFALRRTAEDVYVGATEFRAELEAGLFRVRNYSKVVQP